jgi:hypothetical protein
MIIKRLGTFKWSNFGIMSQGQTQIQEPWHEDHWYYRAKLIMG